MGTYTKNDWFDLIDRVNYTVANPPPNTTCADYGEPVSYPPGPPYKWDIGTIVSLQNALATTFYWTDDPFEFSSIGNIWSQHIVDELEQAITQAWPGCVDLIPCYDVVINNLPPAGGVAPWWINFWSNYYLRVREEGGWGGECGRYRIAGERQRSELFLENMLCGYPLYPGPVGQNRTWKYVQHIPGFVHPDPQDRGICSSIPPEDKIIRWGNIWADGTIQSCGPGNPGGGWASNTGGYLYYRWDDFTHPPPYYSYQTLQATYTLYGYCPEQEVP